MLPKYKKVWASKKEYSKKGDDGKFSTSINLVKDKFEAQTVINSYNEWKKDKTVHTLDNGVEYYVFGEDKNKLTN